MYLKQNTISQLHTNKQTSKIDKQFLKYSELALPICWFPKEYIFHIDLKYKNKYGVSC